MLFSVKLTALITSIVDCYFPLAHTDFVFDTYHQCLVVDLVRVDGIVDILYIYCMDSELFLCRYPAGNSPFVEATINGLAESDGKTWIPIPVEAYENVEAMMARLYLCLSEIAPELRLLFVDLGKEVEVS